MGEPVPEDLRLRVSRVLDRSCLRCARCKVCDTQVEVMVTLIRELLAEASPDRDLPAPGHPSLPPKA